MPASIQRYDLLRKRLDAFTRMLHRVGRGEARALHRTRVASRRLRELLPVLQIENDVARKLNRRIRRVTKRLGAVRELDVINLLLNELQESGGYNAGGLRRAAAVLAQERDEARRRLRAKSTQAELARIAARLEEVTRTLEADRGATSRRHEAAWRWAVDARIASRAQQLQVAMREAGAVYLPERLHRVRIALKKLRYGVELASEIAGEKRSPSLRTLKQTQDVLGRMHDLQVLVDRIRHIQAAAPAELHAERELEAMVDALENDCRRLHARYVRARAALAAICAHAAARPAASAARGAARPAGMRRVAS